MGISELSCDSCPQWGARRPTRVSIVDDPHMRFRQVVLPFLDDCYDLARWLTGDRADAQDVVQDACLQAFRAIGTYAGPNARAWILTIVRHAAYRWLRRNRSAALVMVDDVETLERAQREPLADGGPTPEAELIARAEAARLDGAIAALPLPFRETLVLRDIHGLDYRQIAEVTGVPVGTVMSRLARARSRLIAAMGVDGP
jgi:RNA polymerase sigma-70 factor, ECF subfamily